MINTTTGTCDSYTKDSKDRNPASRLTCRCSLTSAGIVYLARKTKTKMIKTTIAALAATPLLFSGAAFAGPYVNVEASGSYPDGAYSSGTWEFQLGYEGTTPNGIDWYVSGGPTVTHTESADEFGDTELIGYIGGGKTLTDSVGVYGELSAATNVDDVDWAGKAGLKYTF